MNGQFRFSVGPWNIHPGTDPLAPAIAARDYEQLDLLVVHALLGGGSDR